MWEHIIDLHKQLQILNKTHTLNYLFVVHYGTKEMECRHFLPSITTVFTTSTD